MKMDGQIRVKTNSHYARMYNDIKGVAFGDFHEFFFLCACIGYNANNKEPLGKNGEDRFWSSTITAREWACYYAMFLEKNGFDFTAAQDEKVIINKMEEYANAGMKILLNEFLNDYVIGSREDPQLDQGRSRELPKNLLNFVFERINDWNSRAK